MGKLVFSRISFQVGVWNSNSDGKEITISPQEQIVHVIIHFQQVCCKLIIFHLVISEKLDFTLRLTRELQTSEEEVMM